MNLTVYPSWISDRTKSRGCRARLIKQDCVRSTPEIDIVPVTDPKHQCIGEYWVPDHWLASACSRSRQSLPFTSISMTIHQRHALMPRVSSVTASKTCSNTTAASSGKQTQNNQAFHRQGFPGKSTGNMLLVACGLARRNSVGSNCQASHHLQNEATTHCVTDYCICPGR